MRQNRFHLTKKCDIILKKAKLSKDTSIVITLLHKQTDKICEIRRLDIKIKRSWSKLLKTAGGKALEVAKLLK